MKYKRTLMLVILIILCSLLIKKIIDTPVLTGSFYGTYAYEGYTISIMVDDGDFYLMNQPMDIFMKGNYEKKSETTYDLSGNGFQNQQITLKNRSFLLMFDGKEMTFTKISNSPFKIEGLDELVVEYQQKMESEP